MAQPGKSLGQREGRHSGQPDPEWVGPDPIFGSALASMQPHCKAKKKEEEELWLCLPRKIPAPPPAVRHKEFAQGPQAPQPRVQKYTKPTSAHPA